MPDHGNIEQNTATVEQRVDAIQAAFEERGIQAGCAHPFDQN